MIQKAPITSKLQQFLSSATHGHLITSDTWVEHFNTICTQEAGIWTKQPSEVQTSGGKIFHTEKKSVPGILFVFADKRLPHKQDLVLAPCWERSLAWHYSQGNTRQNQIQADIFTRKKKRGISILQMHIYHNKTYWYKSKYSVLSKRLRSDWLPYSLSLVWWLHVMKKIKWPTTVLLKTKSNKYLCLSCCLLKYWMTCRFVLKKLYYSLLIL